MNPPGTDAADRPPNDPSAANAPARDSNTSDAPALAPPAPDEPPDWSRVDAPIPCPRCAYELRMLTTPRCPECGLDFAWRDVLDSIRVRSTRLFEFQWRRRPIRSYFATLFRGLAPAKFWRGVSIYDPVTPGPLIAMLALAPLAALFLVHVSAALAFVLVGVLEFAAYGGSPSWAEVLLEIRYKYELFEPDLRLRQAAGSPASAPSDLGLFTGFLAVLPLMIGEYYLLPLGHIALATLVTVVLVCSLRQTLARRRVRTVQVLRVTAYAAAPALLVCGLMAGGVGGFLVALGIDGTGGPLAAIILPIFFLTAGVLIAGAYLGAGLRRYLDLPRSYIIAMTAVGVGVLTCATVQMAYIALNYP